MVTLCAKLKKWYENVWEYGSHIKWIQKQCDDQVQVLVPDHRRQHFPNQTQLSRELLPKTHCQDLEILLSMCLWRLSWEGLSVHEYITCRAECFKFISCNSSPCLACSMWGVWRPPKGTLGCLGERKLLPNHYHKLCSVQVLSRSAHLKKDHCTTTPPNRNKYNTHAQP